MNLEIKRSVRLLSERYNHTINYEKNTIILRKDFSSIKIWQEDKNSIYVSFTIQDHQENQIKINNEDIYDVLLELFINPKGEESILEKNGILLTIDEWINEEGMYAKEKLTKLKKDLKNGDIKYRALGGNRYEAEYFKSILILTDDLCWAKSNVILL